MKPCNIFILVLYKVPAIKLHHSISSGELLGMNYHLHMTKFVTAILYIHLLQAQISTLQILVKPFNILLFSTYNIMNPFSDSLVPCIHVLVEVAIFLQAPHPALRTMSLPKSSKVEDACISCHYLQTMTWNVPSHLLALSALYALGV